MNNEVLKAIEFEINSLINLRNTYYSIMLVLTGGIVGLFYNLNLTNTILLIIGLFTDLILLLGISRFSYKIKMLIKLTRGF